MMNVKGKGKLSPIKITPRFLPGQASPGQAHVNHIKPISLPLAQFPAVALLPFALGQLLSSLLGRSCFHHQLSSQEKSAKSLHFT